MYELALIGNYDKKILAEIPKEVCEKPEAEGTYELYDSLYLTKYCRSYNKTRIYYVAYTLAKNNIDFKISEFDS